MEFIRVFNIINEYVTLTADMYMLFDISLFQIYFFF